jgi:hypothetical protein
MVFAPTVLALRVLGPKVLGLRTLIEKYICLKVPNLDLVPANKIDGAVVDDAIVGECGHCSRHGRHSGAGLAVVFGKR